MSQYINYHVLISHSPSCLNRDDMNMQKTAVFGGARRVRISSQSLKRAMRKSAYYESVFGPASTRTRELEKLIPLFVEKLKDSFPPEVVSNTMELFVRAHVMEDDGAEDEAAEMDGEKNETKKLAVAPWAVEEIRVLCGIVKDIALTEEELAKAKEKAGKQKGKKKKPEQDFIDEALNKKRAKAIQGQMDLVRQSYQSALDIALSGRMATSGLMTSVDGAMAVAHAITTHAVDGDIDWFTAVDDLVNDAGDVGAGHLNTQEFSSGVFYRYASLNLKQLQVNLGLLPDMKAEETPESRARALDVAAHVLHLLATVVPTAKQNSFAAHNLADFALVSLADQPISLANAFERPVPNEKGRGYLAPSIATLCDYRRKFTEAYGLPEKMAVFSIEPACADANLQAFIRLNDLKAWIQRDGE